MTPPLTKKQKATLDYVRGYIRDKGYAPRIADLMDRFELSSTASANTRLRELEHKGYLSRSGRARGIVLAAGTPCPHCGMVP